MASLRLLHTSDWHLGQTFRDFDRSYEHQCFLDWLLEVLATEHIDVLLVAGDIFDHANPAAEAQRLLYRFLAVAKQRLPHLSMVLIAGNHDSAGRLEAPAPLLAAFGATVIGYARPPQAGLQLERLVIPLHNRAGARAAWCLAVPFLRPGDPPRVETSGDPYPVGVRLLYQQVLARALAQRQPGQAIVALGHCHMANGVTSEDSERRLVIGGAEALPVETFDPAIAYVALGHLHRAQTVGGHPHMRYSGSPLPMSFSEIGYRHQVLRVILDGEQVAEITPLPIPRSVELLRVPAQPAPLAEVLEALRTLSLPPTLSDATRPYLQVRVQAVGFDPTLRASVEAALRDQPVQLASIERSGPPSRSTPDAVGLQSLDEVMRLQPDQIFRQLYQQERGQPPDAALLAAFRELALADSPGGTL